MSEQSPGPEDLSEVGLIAHLAGARPPAPPWFGAALTERPDPQFVSVDGARIEYLAWGRRGDPGLLLLHGNSAHADWWSPLAPLFARPGRRVAALSWSGMGGSDWRERYAPAQFAAEVMAVAAAAGLLDGGARPMVLAHSLGGYFALHAADLFGDRLAGVIVADSPIRPTDFDWPGPPRRTRPNRVYPTLEAALARFRLGPPQPCANLWYVDHIARASLRAVEGGFTWKFDPRIFHHLDMEDPNAVLERALARTPLALIWGDRSRLIPPPVSDHMRALAARLRIPAVILPDADHHLLLDQPLPFVAAVENLLGSWPPAVAPASGAV